MGAVEEPTVHLASAPDGSLTARLTVPTAVAGQTDGAPVLTLVETESGDVLWEADLSAALPLVDAVGVAGISFDTRRYALVFALADGGLVEFDLESKASTQVAFEAEAPDGSLVARLACPAAGAQRVLTLVEKASGSTLWQSDVNAAMVGLGVVTRLAFDPCRFVLLIHDAVGGQVEFNLETKEAVAVPPPAADAGAGQVRGGQEGARADRLMCAPTAPA